MSIAQRNLEFYDSHYRSAHPLLFWLHGALSYDQRSKLRPNLALLLPALRARASARPLHVLDYGCGFGTLLFALPRRGFELYAYDLSERAVLQLVAAARCFGRRVQALALPDFDSAHGELDAIVCSHVLEHVPSDTALIARFVRALRPSGLLLVNVPIHELWDDPKHARRYTEPALRELLERHGLRVLQTQQTDRVSAWLCRYEQRPSLRRPGKVALRGVRLLLGRTPQALLLRAERLLLSQLPPQQLLMLAEKPADLPSAAAG